MTTAADPDAIIKAHSRSFSTASRFLPRSIRGDVVKLYAWCRACDDAVDHAQTPQDAQAQWQCLRDDIDRIGAGVPVHHPASRLLQELMRDCGVTRFQAIDLLRGMQMDLEMDRGDGTIGDQANLLRYCYHAAGVVGLMMCRVMGVKNHTADMHAKSLGIAMQLTNIARDVREDAERGRCYLPGIINPLAQEHRSAVISRVAELLDLADQHYRYAMSAMVYLPVRCRIAIRISAALYQEIGHEIRRNDCDVLAGRTVVPRARFALIAARAAFASPLDIWPFAQRPLVETSNKFSSPTLDPSMEIPMSSQLSLHVLNARANAYLGISLTAFMATALFIMVYMNPKETTYTWLPLLYAGVSLAIAIGTHFASKHYASLQPVRNQ